MHGLYAIVDVDALETHGIPPLEFARAVLAARPFAIQLRAKQASARETVAMLRALRPLATGAGSLLFANDRPDLALVAGADGVHVGQDDLSLPDVRRLPGALKVGVSTHDLAQLELALEDRPDYVAFGPVFRTGSKVRCDPVVGLEALAVAAERARAAGIPLVAIGGINLERAIAVSQVAPCAAVIAGLLENMREQDEIAARASAFQSILGHRREPGARAP